MYRLRLDPVPIDNIVESARRFRRDYGFPHILFSFPFVYDKTKSDWVDSDILTIALMSRINNFHNSVDPMQPLDIKGYESSEILEFSITRHDAIRLARLGILAYYIHKKESPKKRKIKLYVSPLMRRLMNRITFGIVPIPRIWEDSHSSVTIVQAMADVSRNLSYDGEEGIELPQHFWIQPKPPVELNSKHISWKNPVIRDQILERADYTCMNCGNALSLEGGLPTDLVDSELTIPVRESRKLSVDHRIPQSVGGSNEPSNYLAMCEDCNSSKGNKLPMGLTIEDTSKLDVPQLGPTAISNELTRSKKEAEEKITKTEISQLYHRAVYRCSICIIDITLTAHDDIGNAINTDAEYFGSEHQCTLCGTKLHNPEFFTMDD